MTEIYTNRANPPRNRNEADPMAAKKYPPPLTNPSKLPGATMLPNQVKTVPPPKPKGR